MLGPMTSAGEITTTESPETTAGDGRNGSDRARPHARARLAVAAAVGVGAALLTLAMPASITLDGVPVGDVGLPVIAMQRALDGESPYDLILASGPAAQYPFTAMVVLAPFLLLPVPLVAPVFCGLSAAVLAWLVTAGGRWWRLMLFVSVPFVAAVHSVQWSPLVAAALLWPPLLALAVVKPQLGVVLIAAGRWSRTAVIATAGLVLLSLAMRPVWPLEWWHSGVLAQYDAHVPLLVAPGFLLAAGLLFVRARRGRLLVAMAIVPQRFWYDQLLLMLVPSTWRQMTFAVGASWVGAAWCLAAGWDPASGHQLDRFWTAVVVTTHLPALALVAWQHWRRRREAEPQ
jgi:hypothetical protein